MNEGHMCEQTGSGVNKKRAVFVRVASATHISEQRGGVNKGVEFARVSVPWGAPFVSQKRRLKTRINRAVAGAAAFVALVLALAPHT